MLKKYLIDLAALTESSTTTLELDPKTTSALSKIRNFIEHNQPSSILITGYRGVGKTSVVSSAVKPLNNATIANLNLSKFEQQGHLHRKIIRSVFLGMDENKFSKETYKAAKDLYRQTFYSITNEQSNREEDTSSSSISLTTHLYEALLPLLGLSLGILNQKNSNILIGSTTNALLIIISTVALIAKFVSIKKQFKNSKIKTQQELIVSLFDEEVAEHRTLELIAKIHTERKLVLIIDEMDKIDSPEELENITKLLKPILLSGTCYCLIIGGTNVLKRFIQSKYQDDDFIASLFSQHVHIPLNNRALITALTNRAFPKEKMDDLTFSYLLIQCNLVLRRMIMELKRHSNYDSNQWEFTQPQAADDFEYDTAVKLLDEIIQRFSIDNDELINDTITFHLYSWMHKIIFKKSHNFSALDILSKKDTNNLPSEVKSKLDACLKDLLLTLTENGFLEEIIESDKSTKYKLRRNQTSNTESNEFIKAAENAFLSYFIGFEGVVRSVFDHINQGKTKERGKSAGYMLQHLNKHFNSDQDFHGFEELEKIRNKIVHGLPLNEGERNILNDRSNDLRSFRLRIIHHLFHSEFSISLGDKYKIYDHHKHDGKVWDIVCIAKSETLKYQKIFVDYRLSTTARAKQNLLTIASLSNEIAAQPDSIGVLIFASENQDAASITDELSLPKATEGRFIVNTVSDNSTLFSTERIRETMKTIVAKTNHQEQEID